MAHGLLHRTSFRAGRRLAALAVALAVPAAARAQSFAGTWTEAERSMTVTITSWGEDCPTQPQSSSSRPGTPLAVAQEGDQLVFPGGRRTDRCWSDNRSMRRTRFSKQGSRWTVECETPADDARREQGRYVVNAETTRIVIELDSEYDWTLREDHCQARIVERRVLTRAAPAEADGGTADASEDGGRGDADADAGDVFVRVDAGGGLLPLPEAGTAPRRCDRPGPAARLRIRAVQTVRPGGRVPISVHQVDADGCALGPVAASFEIVGAPRGCRIGADGVFQACDAVAQCDGETVRIRVSVGALSGMADIRISARIEDGLGTVEPVWIDEPAGAGSGQPLGGAQVSASLQAQGSPAATGGTPAAGGGPAAGGSGQAAGGGTPKEEEEEEPDVALWLVVGGGGVIVLAVIFYLVLAGRRGRRKKLDTFDDLAGLRAPPSISGRPMAVMPSAAAAIPVTAPIPPTSLAPSLPSPVLPSSAPVSMPPVPAAALAASGWHCPACRKEYAVGGYCADDGMALSSGPAPTGPRAAIFLACPKCGRGHGAESKFCPNDRELLLPYGLGMNNYRAGLKGRPEPPERLCPKCGTRAPGAARFCSKDGEMLVPQR